MFQLDRNHVGQVASVSAAGPWLFDEGASEKANGVHQEGERQMANHEVFDSRITGEEVAASIDGGSQDSVGSARDDLFIHRALRGHKVMNASAISTRTRPAFERIARPGDDLPPCVTGASGAESKSPTHPGEDPGHADSRLLGNPPDAGSPMPEASNNEIIARLDRLDERIAELCDLLASQRVIRDYYTPEEAAKILGKAPFTVREWCRCGRVRAQKRGSGRGKHQGWVISHEELKRFQREGLLPGK